MAAKYKDHYRISTTRASWWNYNHEGLYFITICTYGMECYFGQIENNEMHLSAIGKIAQTCWDEISSHMPYVKIHAMVVMPNHVHGIIEILQEQNVEMRHQETEHAPSVPAPFASFAQMLNNAPVQTLPATSPVSSINKNEFMARISPKRGSLASIIRSYKSAVSKQVHPLNLNFCWKERYYDIIIKDTPAYQHIEAYIKNNVSSWNDDKFFKNNK